MLQRKLRATQRGPATDDRHNLCRAVKAPAPSAPAIRKPDPNAKQSKNADSGLLGLVQWAIANKIEFSGCRPEVKNGVRGVYATTDVNGGETLIAVPLEVRGRGSRRGRACQCCAATPFVSKLVDSSVIATMNG